MDAQVETTPIEDTQLLMKIMRNVNIQAFKTFGDRVYTGPFTGMIIPSHWEHWDDGNGSTKLFGTYEHELHEVVYRAAWRQPRVVINVGCAEGYYAIGLARMLPNAVVHALDINPDALNICKEYSEKNSVNVVTHNGALEPEDLRFDTWAKRRLYVVDVEGSEVKLLNPEKCPELILSDIIVECHDFMNADISVYLADKFAPTHSVEVIKSRLPNYEQFQFVRQCPNILSVLAVTEKRPLPTYWLACWANRRSEDV